MTTNKPDQTNETEAPAETRVQTEIQNKPGSMPPAAAPEQEPPEDDD